MELAPIPDEAVVRAGRGDAQAAANLLMRLASKSPQEQLSALRSLRQAEDASFWRHLLGYLATQQWSGHPLPAEEPALWTALRSRIQTLFLTSDLTPAALHARRQALIEGCASAHPGIKTSAVAIVAGATGEEGLPAVIAALHDERRDVRLAAAHALASLRDARAVPALVELLNNDDGVLAGLAKDALVSIRTSAVAPLIGLLQRRDTGNQARWLAARVLEQIADDSAIPALVATLDDPDYGVRWAVAHGLAALRVAGVRATLEALISRQLNPWLADAAAQVLHHVQQKDVATTVKPVLAALQSVDFEWQAPPAARQALDELDAKGHG